VTPAPLGDALPAILDGLPVGIFVLAADGTPVYANPAAHALLGAGADPSIGVAQLASTYHARQAGTGQPYPAEQMPIVRALAGETTTVDDMEIERPDGTVPVEVWAAAIRGPDDEVAYAVAAFHDLTARRRAEADAARLYAETIRQRRWLAAVREVQFSVLSGAGLDDALDLVARRARDLLAGDGTCIGIPDGDGSLVIRAAAGLGDATLRGARLSVADSIMGEVIGMAAAAVLDDVSTHGTLADPVVRLEMGAAVFVPLTAEGRAFGALCVARRRGEPLFSEDDVVAAEAFANQAAMAVQIGWAQRELAHLAVARDRRRRAEDLHESIFASLSSLRGRLSEGDVEHAVAELDQVILDIGAHAGASTNGPSNGGGLEKGLVELAAEFEARTGVVTVVDVDGQAVVALVGRTGEVLDLVRGALSSVDRRMGARTCQLTVACVASGVVVAVDDDGLDATPADQRDRSDRVVRLAARAGARAEVQGAPGGGTRVRFALAPP
jgi:PAS domain S-box-containing protein